MTTVMAQLGQRLTRLECSGELYQKLRDYWSYYPENYFRVPSYQLWLQAKKRALREDDDMALDGLPGWDGRKRLLSRNCLPSGLFRATYRECQQELQLRFRIRRSGQFKLQQLPIPPDSDNKYDYQTECATVMQQRARFGGGIVLSATGSGKTATAGKFAKSLPRATVLFCVDTIDLLYQSQSEIAQWAGEAVGVVGDQKFEPQRITVATIQTLNKHHKKLQFKHWYHKVQILVVDELHEQMARRNFELLQQISPLAIYGLTATLQLQRKDVRYPAFSFAGPVIYQFPLQEGIERGVLTSGQVVQLLFPALPVTSNGEEEYQIQVVRNTVKHDTCHTLVRHLIERGRYVLVLVERVEHIQLLHELFRDIPHRLAYGAVNKKDRKEAVQSMEDGDIHLLIANKVFRKGINIKRVDVGFDLSEMKSKNHAQQKFGRLVRLFPGKEKLLYVDFGTQKKPHLDLGLRFARAASSRRNAFLASGIPVKRVKVGDYGEALCQLKKLA